MQAAMPPAYGVVCSRSGCAVQTLSTKVPMEPEDRTPFLPLFLAAMTFVVLAPIFWMHAELPDGRAIARSYENIDLYQRVYPNFAYGAERLRAGALPLWNAQQLCGTPFLANPATGVFQPLNAVALLLTPERAMAAQAFLGLALMGAFFVLFLREVGVRITAAVAGGMVYAFGGGTAAAMSRPELLATLAWTPLYFWAMHRLATRPGRANAAVTGVAAALVLLGGSPPLAALMLPLGMLYGGLQAFQRPRERGAPSLPRAAFLALATGVGLSAAQWWPTLAWLSHLDAPGGVLGRIDVPGQMPAFLLELMTQMLSPAPDLAPRLGYVGVAALVLMPVAFTRRGALRTTLFFALMMIGGLSLALSGRALGVTAFSPQAFLFPAILGMAVLTALGADRLLVRTRDVQSPKLWLPWTLFLLAVVVVFFAGGTLVRGRLIATVVVLLPVVFVRRRPVSLICGMLLALVSFVDLRAASVNFFQHPFQDAAMALRAYDPVIALAREQALDGRALVSAHPLHAGLPANLGMLRPLPCAGGTALPLTQDQAVWWSGLIAPDSAMLPGRPLELSRQAPHRALLNPMAARAILATGDSTLARGDWAPAGPPLRLLSNTQGIDILINDAAAPRAHWVSRWQAAENLNAAIEQLCAPEFDANQICVVTGSDVDHAKLATVVARVDGNVPVPPGDPVPCRVEDRAPELVRIHVDAPEPGITVLADTDAPGWIARLDGQRVPILKVNGIFRGIATPAGAHTIEFVYRPWSVYLGIGTALLTAVALLAVGCHALVVQGREGRA